MIIVGSPNFLVLSFRNMEIYEVLKWKLTPLSLKMCPSEFDFFFLNPSQWDMPSRKNEHHRSDLYIFSSFFLIYRCTYSLSGSSLVTVYKSPPDINRHLCTARNGPLFRGPARPESEGYFLYKDSFPNRILKSLW
jgi:hypothetical protein